MLSSWPPNVSSDETPTPIAMLRAVQMMDRLDQSDLEYLSDPLATWGTRSSEALAIEPLGSQDLVDIPQALDGVVRVPLMNWCEAREALGSLPGHRQDSDSVLANTEACVSHLRHT